VTACRYVLAIAVAFSLPGAALACFVPAGTQELRMATEHDAAASQGARWSSFYIDSIVLGIGGYEYSKYGLPRVLGPADLELAAFYEGVPFFRAGGETEILPEIFYFLVDPMTCEFQPYQIGEKL
jgi:hypothetical protein